MATWHGDEVTCRRCRYRIDNPRKGPPRTDAEKVLFRRRFWMARFPEAKQPCASCPFRADNDEAFQEVCKQIAEVAGRTVGGTAITRKATTDIARLKIRREVRSCGDFVCHSTVYRDDCRERSPESAWRQCPGATRFFKTGQGVEEQDG